MYAKRPRLLLTALLACLAPLAGQGRALTPEDWFRFRDVSDLKIAPDGSAVAYLVTSYDKASDESRSALWTVAWSGRDSVQLTRGESVSEPRFSPDGRFLSFLSARPAGSSSQLFVLDRRGGEARQVSHVTGEITGYEWSPDGQHVVLVMHAEEDSKPPKPLVIDAIRFKEDKKGYLTAGSRTHLYLLDVRSGTVEPLTTDAERADSRPAFSPDGRQIAYVSNGAVDARDAAIDEIRLIAAAAGAKPRRLLSTWSPNRQRLAWSPDGTLLAFLQGDELKYNAYIMDRLAVADVSSGKVRTLTEGLDRAVLLPAFASDGRTLLFAVEATPPVPGSGVTRERRDQAARRSHGGERARHGARSHGGAGLERPAARGGVRP